MEKYLLTLNMIGYGIIAFIFSKKVTSLVDAFNKIDSDRYLYNMFIEKKIEYFESKINELIQLQTKNESDKSVKKEPRIKRKYTRRINVQP